MQQRTLFDSIGRGFHYLLITELLLSTLVFLFVFVINWEARFFGMKLDGLPAGLLLGIRFLIPAVMALILIRYPKNILPVALMAMVYFGFFFIDSSMTIQMNTGGKELFGIIPFLSVLIPAIVVISNFLVIRLGNRKERD